MMRELFIFFSLMLMPVFCVAACDEDDGAGLGGESSLVSFEAGLCKKEADDSSELGPMWIYTVHDETALDGLQCVSWAQGDGALRIDLINFEEGCSAEWDGDAAVSDNRVTLNVKNPECRQANCGWCIYDWSFEVEGVDDSREVEVTIAVDDCPEESEIASFSAAIPAGQKEGIVCRYANHNALVDQAGTLGEMGTLHMPCSGSEYPPQERPELLCADDLLCTEVPNGNGKAPVCLAPCETDADCVLPDILACEAGVCQIADLWEG